MNFIAIEKASREAGPALEELQLRGAILRCSKGFSLRANSLIVLSSQCGDWNKLVRCCENFFTRRNQPSVVRISSITKSAGLDSHLHELGYEKVKPSRVLLRRLGETTVISTSIEEVSIKKWLENFYSLHQGCEKDREVHSQLLDKAMGKCIPAVIVNEQGETLCCGLCVVNGEFAGLFSIVTNINYRQKNLATSLIQFLLSRAKITGATFAYLQVEDTNAAARDLYRKLGFSTAYKYWYRVKKARVKLKGIRH